MLLLLFWDSMDSSKRPTCWQQGGVCKDSQRVGGRWVAGGVWGGVTGSQSVWHRVEKTNVADGFQSMERDGDD